MNASEQANSLEIATKIAAMVNLFKSQFPDAKADLKPWQNDPDTREYLDPDSIDVGFHLPGWSRRWQSRSILLQIRLYCDPIEHNQRVIGIDVVGFNHQGQVWKLSTIDNWQFSGNYLPNEDIAEQLRDFCRQTLELFRQKTPER